MKTVTAVECGFPHKNHFDLFYGGRYLPTADSKPVPVSALPRYIKMYHPTVIKVIVKRCDGSRSRRTITQSPYGPVITDSRPYHVEEATV